MSELTPANAQACIERILQILQDARARALQSVNTEMLVAYWEIGREIVEEEQRGQARADYGTRLMEQISARLTSEIGRGFGVRNVRLIRQLYLTWPERRPQIRNSANSELPATVTSPWRPELSWSHYRILMRVQRPDARSFYEMECARARWNTRDLSRQISSLLFERLARSRDKEGVLALARDGHEVHKPSDLIKDPYVLEFVDLPEAARWLESDLESALMDGLQQFLLELGHDLFFVARQKRLTIDGDHYHVDLVFYHRVLRCFLLVDLKVGRISHRDIGQMMVYLGYFEAEETRKDENPPIGLILGTDRNEAMVQYALSQTSSKLFAARYQLHLPSEDELAAELRREHELLTRERWLMEE